MHSSDGSDLNRAKGSVLDKIISVSFVVVLGLIVWMVSPPPKNETVKAAVVANIDVKNTKIGELIGQDETAKLERRRAKYRVDKETQAAKNGPRSKVESLGQKQFDMNSECDLKPGEVRDVMPPWSDYDEDPRTGIPENAHEIAAWPVVTEGEFAVKGYVDPQEIVAKQVPYEVPPEEDPHPHFPKTDFKESLGRYFEGIEDGPMPETVYVEEALPGSLVSLLGLPPKTKLTMLGAHYTDNVRSWRTALALPDDLNTVFGISYVTPDGRSTRQYIKFNAPK